MSIADNLTAIRERIYRASERASRVTSDVTLVAVSKTVAVESIQEAIAAGVTHLGENRVQEAAEKFALRGRLDAGLINREGITLHMIGTLQRNKANKAASLFDWVQSVDRAEIASSLEKATAEVRPAIPLPMLLEVNLTGEARKSGVSQADLPWLADALSGCFHLRPMGLMTIARQGANERELRATFSTLCRLLEMLRSSHPGDWLHLSMGMSDDFEIAIEEGATIVRLGRAIFGERTRKT